jgi:hypothetical protein
MKWNDVNFPVLDDRWEQPPVLSMDQYADFVLEGLRWYPVTDEERKRRIADAVNVPFEVASPGPSDLPRVNRSL